tara:strand:+ start:157 stop:492 length:336 start_codon:yes stop_codon:yes gene_type:complete
LVSTGLTTKTYEKAASGTENVTTTRSRLKGVVVTPSSNSGADRRVQFKNGSSSDVLFEISAHRRESDGYSAETQKFIIPSNGILFPDGITFDKNNYFENLTVIWQGPKAAG